MSEKPAQNSLRILRVLDECHVDHVVIGGVAAQAHGHQRTTLDLDVIVKPDRENYERLEKALGTLGAQMGFIEREHLGMELDADTLAQNTMFETMTEAGGLDIFNEVPGGVPYEELAARSVAVPMAGIEFQVASLDDLIRMKQASGRDEDLRDVAALTDPGRLEAPPLRELLDPGKDP